jgi:hypothetical protein
MKGGGVDRYGFHSTKRLFKEELMKLTIRTLLPLSFFLLVLTACGGPCEEADLLIRPDQDSPANHSLVSDLRPVLTWQYSPCTPEEYIINLWTNATNGTSVDTGFGGLTGSPDKSWSPPADLTVGEAYIWSVAAKNSTLISPYSPDWEFIVGPACDAASLLPPDPVEPSGTIADLDPTYIWDYSDLDCTPGGYSLQVAPNNTFTGLVVNMREANPIKAWSPGVPLNDCDRYYWRVAGIDGASDGPWSGATSFRVNAYGNCICLSSELQVPVPVWPGHYEIVPDVQPVLRWLYNGHCEVGGYAIHLSTEHDFSDTSLFGGTGSPSTRWMAGEDLQPATQYWWQVASGVGTDFSGFSSPRSFFTGPECAAINDMVAPTLLSPIGGDQVTQEFATLRYTPGAGGCIPDGYFVNLQTDPLFGGTNLLGSYNFPGTTVLTDPLEDCTTYYWKVAQIQAGVHGPLSATEWFYTNYSGTCPGPLPTPTPTPIGPPTFHFLQNAFCRRGPGPEYGTAAAYEKDEIVELTGRSEPGRPLWWYTPWRCWVSDITGEASGPVDGLPIIPAPPLPTPTPTPVPLVCHEKIQTQAECRAAGGTWVESSAAAGHCDCP